MHPFACVTAQAPLVPLRTSSASSLVRAGGRVLCSRVGVRAMLLVRNDPVLLRALPVSSKPSDVRYFSNRSAPALPTSAVKMNDSLIVTEDAEPSTDLEPRKGDRMTSKVLADLTEKGEIHDETLQAMEESEEWRNYEAEVQFEMVMMRSRYAADGEQMTSQRRSQMQAHLRQVQQKVMNEHADKAARKFVEGVTAEEVRLLRRILTRIDGMPTSTDGGRAMLDIGTVKTVDGQELKHALWQLSEELGKAEPELRRTLRGMLGGGIAQAPPNAVPAGQAHPQLPAHAPPMGKTREDM